MRKVLEELLLLAGAAAAAAAAAAVARSQISTNMTTEFKNHSLFNSEVGRPAARTLRSSLYSAPVPARGKKLFSFLSQRCLIN